MTRKIVLTVIAFPAAYIEIFIVAVLIGLLRGLFKINVSIPDWFPFIELILFFAISVYLIWKNKKK